MLTLEQALQQIEELNAIIERSNQKFESEKERLIQLIASWKRKAEGKRGFRRETLREGYSAVTGMHYKVYSIDLPGDLPVEEVLNYLKENILQGLYPYTFKKMDYVPKKKEWVFEVEMDIAFDIQLENEFLLKYYQNN
ncbi:hypothetical protein [Rummeliibacillus stabekisii]|uniref:hypothetical protein n=1 Tax=Rummeliibacillus stabekisii TaxID=241244 RepID=UPI00116F6CE8|nr:hypothetical protein [Rummeliibacillus stabekisii]MBB5170711.1 hypothetical protein [Rummeliibacillus stabekisii]GEL06205.1 hypothetical protein RST01_28320 [Rummeliibacillus stabekisii]